MTRVSRTWILTLSALATFVSVRSAEAQSSSLYQKEFDKREKLQHESLETGSGIRADSNVIKTVESASLIAVELPPPRKFKLHDRIVIVVRESKSYRSESDLEQEKEWDIDAKLQEWFRFFPRQRLGSDRLPNGQPGVKLNFDTELEYEAEHRRRDDLTLRIAAEVIDVKPNGTLTLMATKRIKNDEEIQNMTLTGRCSSEDVTAEGSVLSSQVLDLDVEIQHNGAVRDGSRRGWVPRLFDFLRPF